ncbi:polyphosphate kinase 1 [Treponema maltophilum]|uniref:polyphosphate kinase 1 n=1 Tax=Treponema maltophilum TaxID=51160 RepID=UPI003D8E0520
MKTKTSREKQKNVFFNRELSWIEFNARVLAEAKRTENPLLERLKFLAIVSSNFDEFFMVRVAELKRRLNANPQQRDDSLLSPGECLDAVSRRVHELFTIQHNTLHEELLPLLAQKGLEYVKPKDFTADEKRFAERFFCERVLPRLAPSECSENGKLPRVENMRLYAAFLLKPLGDNELAGALPEEKRIAVVPLPAKTERIVPLPAHDCTKSHVHNDAEKNRAGTSRYRFTLLDDIILAFGARLFKDSSVRQSLIFKTVGDAGAPVQEERDEFFIPTLEKNLAKRRFSSPVRLTCTAGSPALTHILAEKMKLQERDIYVSPSIIGVASLNKLADMKSFAHLRYPAREPLYPVRLDPDEPLWDVLKRQDILLHLPYESYDPVLRFINDAADDPDVSDIKMTLYRTSGDSAVIKALERASRSGKRVRVFVEVKARFDERRNIRWVRRLQRSGAHVKYKIGDLKVHAKMLLVVRREGPKTVRYVHTATGNYNEKTARQYSDLSLFTSDPETANDAEAFFNMISGYSEIRALKNLYLSPVNLKSHLLYLIRRECRFSSAEKPGLIIAKMNGLGDPDIIKALYEASGAHVRIMLNVRSVCMLVPGVKNLSEHIEVVSIVDRFLEHSRIFYFQNGGAEELYLSSADWMSRNLDRRVELMVPVTRETQFRDIKDTLELYFADNTRSHMLNADGTWTMKKPRAGEKAVRAQESLYEKYGRAAPRT